MGCESTSVSSPVQEESWRGHAFTCRPPWLSGAGSDAGDLAQVVTLPLPPRGSGPARWRAWALSGRHGGERSFGPGPNPRGGGGAIAPSSLGPPVATGDFQLSLSISREGLTTFQHPVKEVRLGGFHVGGHQLWWAATAGSSTGNSSSSIMRGGLGNVSVEGGTMCPWRAGQRVRGGLGDVSVEGWAMCPWRAGQCVRGVLVNVSVEVWSTCPLGSSNVFMKAQSRHPSRST